MSKSTEFEVFSDATLSETFHYYSTTVMQEKTMFVRLETPTA